MKMNDAFLKIKSNHIDECGYWPKNKIKSASCLMHREIWQFTDANIKHRHMETYKWDII